jgi:hypothetical protein
MSRRPAKAAGLASLYFPDKKDICFVDICQRQHGIISVLIAHAGPAKTTNSSSGVKALLRESVRRL